MIEIKCSKAQYNRIIYAMANAQLSNGRCVIGKSYQTCPALYVDKSLTCEACIRKRVKRIED